MPKMNLSVPHQLTKEEATDRLNQFLDGVKQKYQDEVSDLHQAWEGDNLDFGFRTMGMGIKGRLTVEEGQLTMNGDLPFAAMMFKGKIESGIREELAKLLA